MYVLEVLKISIGNLAEGLLQLMGFMSNFFLVLALVILTRIVQQLLLARNSTLSQKKLNSWYLLAVGRSTSIGRENEGRLKDMHPKLSRRTTWLQ